MRHTDTLLQLAVLLGDAFLRRVAVLTLVVEPQARPALWPDPIAPLRAREYIRAQLVSKRKSREREREWGALRRTSLRLRQSVQALPRFNGGALVFPLLAAVPPAPELDPTDSSLTPPPPSNTIVAGSGDAGRFFPPPDADCGIGRLTGVPPLCTWDGDVDAAPPLALSQPGLSRDWDDDGRIVWSERGGGGGASAA